jgi:hypothetical protein
MAAVKFEVVEKNGQAVVHEIHKIVVHTFGIGDVEDPDIYAAQPIWDWQQTDAGKFVMENAINTPSYHQNLDQHTYGYRYAIVAELEAKKLSEFYLRWGKDGSSKIR